MSGSPFTKEKISQEKYQQALTNDLLLEQTGREIRDGLPFCSWNSGGAALTERGQRGRGGLKGKICSVLGILWDSAAYNNLS